jgi:hypothetical protein
MRMRPRLPLCDLLREIGYPLPLTGLGGISHPRRRSGIRPQPGQLRGLITNDVVALTGRCLPPGGIRICHVQTLLQRVDRLPARLLADRLDPDG